MTAATKNRKGIRATRPMPTAEHVRALSRTIASKKIAVERRTWNDLSICFMIAPNDSSRGFRMAGQEFPHVFQNLRVHRQRHFARRSILLARMINPEKSRPDLRQIHLSPMPKRKRRARNNKSLRLQNSQINIPPNFTERQNRARL